MTIRDEVLYKHFDERRKTGRDSRLCEAWPQYPQPHKFVPWPNHVACAWCCGAPSNKTWHPKGAPEIT